MPALVDLLANLGIIFTLVGVWSLWFDAGFGRPAMVGRSAVVALAGIACVVLLISFPVEVIEGAIFDLRAVPIVLTGIFGGPAAGILVGVVRRLSACRRGRRCLAGCGRDSADDAGCSRRSSSSAAPDLHRVACSAGFGSGACKPARADPATP
ncbi:MAG: hypothetical protein J0H08_14610 [Rhizobiales bacterium]|nr:hypothetical protein [Hyphomicrobiales bacterium]